MGTPSGQWLVKAQAAARAAHERHLLAMAYLVFLAFMFFMTSERQANLIYLLAVLPLAMLESLRTGRERMPHSAVLWACAVYLTAMTVASALGAFGSWSQVLRDARFSAIILTFIAVTAYLCLVDRRFAAWLFVFVGSAAAASALVNIALYFAYLAPSAPVAIVHYRLQASIGMPGYENSTNISATYAVFFVGALATLVRGRLPQAHNMVLVAAAAALLAGVLATQSRSALLAVMAGAGLLVLALPLRQRLFAIGAAVIVAGLLVTTVPEIGEAIFDRGASSRPEAWAKFLDLIAARAWTGYGSLDPIGVVVGDNIFINQAHNLVLSAWFRGGVASAAAMAFILAGGLYWTWRCWVETGQIAPLCVLATIAVAGMFDYQLLATHPSWPWLTFWLPFGLAAGAETMVRRERARAARRGPSGVVATERANEGLDIEPARQGVGMQEERRS